MANKIFTLIPKIMAEVGAIEKTRTNHQQGYAFRGIDDVYSALQLLLAKHGVFYTPKVINQVREERESVNKKLLIYTVLTVEFRFFADDGSSIEVVTVGEAMDSGDKSANKAMSAALKYAVIMLFCIPTREDNDTENQSPEPLPRAKQERSLLQSPGDYVVQFGTKYKGIAVKDIDIQDLVDYVAYLESSAREQKKALGGAVKEFVGYAKQYLELGVVPF